MQLPVSLCSPQCDSASLREKTFELDKGVDLDTCPVPRRHLLVDAHPRLLQQPHRQFALPLLCSSWFADGTMIRTPQSIDVLDGTCNAHTGTRMYTLCSLSTCEFPHCPCRSNRTCLPQLPVFGHQHGVGSETRPEQGTQAEVIERAQIRGVAPLGVTV